MVLPEICPDMPEICMETLFETLEPSFDSMPLWMLFWADMLVV
jgi:hypothetical protein